MVKAAKEQAGKEAGFTRLSYPDLTPICAGSPYRKREGEALPFGSQASRFPMSASGVAAEPMP